MTHEDLDDLDQRADRLLDGMSVHREKLARDLRAVTAELRRWREAHARTQTDGPKQASFADAFADLFAEGPLGKKR